MSLTTDGTAADRLYRLLPEVYRARDNGDLKAYLAAFDGVLELFRKALDQKLADAFPETAQGWVLPYLAELLDLKLLSPDDEGRRKEIASAMYWRKRKGTPRAIEQVVTSIGRFGWPGLDPSFVIKEAYPRVLVTPRVGDVLPAGAPGALKIPAPSWADPANPRRIARDPGLPMGTVDLRYRSRRVRPASDQPPLQANPHSIPRWPGTIEDVSRQTPDLRAPTWRQGHVHPKRVLIYAAPYPGFFPPGYTTRDGVKIDLTDGNDHSLEDTVIMGTLEVTVGRGRLTLARCAIGMLVVNGDPGSASGSRILATGCLFGLILAQDPVPAHIQLVGVTVLSSTYAGRVWASDSLFAGSLTPSLDDSRLRYSRVPSEFVHGNAKVTSYRCFDDAPHFASSTLGESGCGVLRPVSSRRLREGAEDGGEVGAYHHLRYAARARALLETLQDELPVGQAAALIPDERLVETPPVVTKAPQNP